MLETILLTANTLVLFLIAYGLWVRHQPQKHMKVMYSCFASDLIIVVLVEVGNHLEGGSGAVAKGVGTVADGENGLLIFHIAVSVIFLVCYGYAIFSGRRLHRTGEGRGKHKINAIIFIFTRLLNWITSFYV